MNRLSNIKKFMLSTAIAAIMSQTPLSAAQYQPINPNTAIKPGVYLDKLYEEIYAEGYGIQKLSEKTYWIGIYAYNALAIVGDNGVIVIDTLQPGQSTAVFNAVKEITDKPITAIIYSHYHLDHTGGAQEMIDAIIKDGSKMPAIYASESTAKQIARFGNKIPAPTHLIKGHDEMFNVEGIELRMISPVDSGHSVDHSMVLVPSERVLSFPDMINPDQVPFLDFAFSHDLMAWKENLEFALTLDWDIMQAGHGNIGSRKDIEFSLAYFNDVKIAIEAAKTTVDFYAILAESPTVNAAMRTYGQALAKTARPMLESKYNDVIGFNDSFETHAIKMFELITFR